MKSAGKGCKDIIVGGRETSPAEGWILFSTWMAYLAPLSNRLSSLSKMCTSISSKDCWMDCCHEDFSLVLKCLHNCRMDYCLHLVQTYMLPRG